jgi:hypothetical protein
MRNYRTSPPSVEDIVDAAEWWLNSGNPTGFYENIIFVGKSLGNGCFEFHSLNGGTVRNLLEGTRMLLADLSEHFSTAVTYYDNPRVEAFAKWMGYAFNTARIDEGFQRTFATTFDLRS